MWADDSFGRFAAEVINQGGIRVEIYPRRGTCVALYALPSTVSCELEG